MDIQCIKDNARNIIIILTDGYLYQKGNTLKEGKSYNYILPATLEAGQESIIAKRKGLDNLEVLMLEVNPKKATDKTPMISLLKNWFSAMGVQHVEVYETDIPSNITAPIEKFLNN